MLLYLIAGFVFAALLSVAAIMVAGPDKLWSALYGGPDLGPFDLETLKRTTKPHDALLCTPGACPPELEADGALPAYADDPAALLTKLVQKAEAGPDNAQQVGGSATDGTVRFVTRTASMKFPDTNQFWAVSMPDGKTGLVAYARAQVGYSDLGVNRKRLESWTANLANEN
ncbi:MAG: DUF1499 domain-containing protein [Pseudomonadota bacterium]